MLSEESVVQRYMGERSVWVRVVVGALALGVGACRDPAAAPADTDTETDTSTGADTDPATATDTDTETEGEPVVETTELVVDVAFANDMMQALTNSVHVWVLQPDGMPVTCADLVSDAIDPYDLDLRRLADHVSTTPAQPVEIASVELGDALVYVEGVTVGGMAELAGCQPVELVQPSTSVEVVLGLAGTFDCSDPATEAGAPCDDGAFCTIGETCSGGECKGGSVRDCSILADQCNAAECSEVDGCVISPVPNDTQCNDGLACTEFDSCQDGSCIGVLRNCDAEVEVCTMSLGCAEPTGECIIVSADEGLPCDDGEFCTEGTICLSGACVGTPLECPGDDCNIPMCDETGDECVTTFADDTTVCTNADVQCAEPTGLCDGAGACVAAPANEGEPCDNDGTPGICTEGVCV